MAQLKPGMSIIVQSISRLTAGMILVFGMHIILHGHLSPGGGFAGGVIIALAFVNLLIAFGAKTGISRVSENLASNLETVGAMMFLTVALLGFLGGTFFLNILSKGEAFSLFSAGTIPLSNISIGLKVGVGLFAIFLALVILEKARK
ncbi:MAG: MnhB domain-containing protein [Candidatus Omnitrophota bacterium]|jgi:multicomponent Na+:H+ antiporter subunit B